MSVIAEYTVPTESFALSATLAAVPGMVVEIERVVAHGQDQVVPYLWVTGEADDEFDRIVRDDPTTTEVTKLDTYEDGTLYRAKWTRKIESVVHAYTETGATIVEAVGRASGWELRMRFDEERLVAAFGDYCRDNDVAFELNRLYHPTEPMAGGQFGLTPKQRTALVAALDRGYFDIPRRSTMGEVADELGISQQSLSKRLRRGHRNLVSNVLTVGGSQDGDGDGNAG